LQEHIAWQGDQLGDVIVKNHKANMEWLVTTDILCEERIPTRCNNIDDLLSIPDVVY